jgi:hypothetical protein
MDKKPESLYAHGIAVIRKILTHNLGSISAIISNGRMSVVIKQSPVNDLLPKSDKGTAMTIFVFGGWSSIVSIRHQP